VLRTAAARLGLPVYIALAFVSTARAERPRLRLSVAPMYALAFIDGRDPSGGGASADLALGLTEALSIRVTGFVSFHHASGQPITTSDMTRVGPDGTMSAFGAFAGISYELPVLRVVPSFDLGLGAIGLRGDARFGSGADASIVTPPLTAFAVELGFGVDWLITRRWALGAVVRYHALVTELTRAPSFLYVGPRVSLTLPQ
jgi:hypothetical protein